MSRRMIKSAPLAIRNNNDVLFLRSRGLLDQTLEYIKNPHLEQLYWIGQIKDADMIDVIVNTMRPNTEISVSPNKQFSITESELNIGDVWAIDEHGVITIVLVVDEKDVRSLVFSNEIFRHAELMRLITPWSYIIVHYEFEPFEHNHIIEMALISLQELGVIITSVGYINISEHITRIITRDRRDKRNEPQRNFVTTTDGESILLSLPGIGPAKLATLLTECGDVTMALCALTDLSIKTPLITTDQKIKIRKALELDDDMILAPVPANSAIYRGKTDAKQPVSNSERSGTEQSTGSGQQSTLDLD